MESDMGASRRDFVKGAAIAAAGLGLGALAPRAALAAGRTGTSKGSGKTLLILGGTKFLGPEIVAAARKAGYTVTLFNRGRTNPQLFPDLEKLRGDRDGKLDALRGRSWDAVVDTSGYVPRHVALSAGLLRDAVRQYVFISTISVYADFSRPGMDETAPVGKLADDTVEKVDGETYGPLKALCEKAVEREMPGRATIIRPGLIVGPNDPTDRFTYWPVRVARGGEVLAPGSPADPVQFIDVRDLAEWTVRMMDSRSFGTFNATGPRQSLGIGQLLDACRKVSGSGATFTWVDADFLAEHRVEPWSDMPVWVPGRGESAGLARVSIRRALDRGLAFRPLEATLADTLAWWRGLPAERRASLGAGIGPEREAEVLAAWRARRT